MNYSSPLIRFVHEKLPHRENLIGQMLRYAVTGGLAFVVDFGLFAFFLYVVPLHYLIANLIGLAGGLVVNYLISVCWVFTACKRNFEKRKGIEFLLFVIIGLIGVGLNQFLIWLMIGLWNWMPLLSKMVAAVLVLLWNFGGRKILLFRTKTETV